MFGYNIHTCIERKHAQPPVYFSSIFKQLPPIMRTFEMRSSPPWKNQASLSLNGFPSANLRRPKAEAGHSFTRPPAPRTPRSPAGSPCAPAVQPCVRSRSVVREEKDRRKDSCGVMAVGKMVPEDGPVDLPAIGQARYMVLGGSRELRREISKRQ